MNRHRCAVWRSLALFPSSLRSSIRASVASLAAVCQGMCMWARARAYVLVLVIHLSDYAEVCGAFLQSIDL